MDILIRNARKEDAEEAVPLIMEAIGDISMQMTGETEETKITKEFDNYLKGQIIDIPIYIRILQKWKEKLLGSSCFILLNRLLHSMQI